MTLQHPILRQKQRRNMGEASCLPTLMFSMGVEIFLSRMSYDSSLARLIIVDLKEETRIIVLLLIKCQLHCAFVTFELYIICANCESGTVSPEQ